MLNPMQRQRRQRRESCGKWSSDFLYLRRVSTAIQLTSQVLPPSSENDCSKRHESAVMSDQTLRTRIVRPSKDSWSKNSPRPSLNFPIVGTLKIPLLTLAVLRLHCRDCGSYRRRDKT